MSERQKVAALLLIDYSKRRRLEATTAISTQTEDTHKLQNMERQHYELLVCESNNKKHMWV